MKLKIVSNGTSLGTKVMNLETGEEIECTKRVNWQFMVRDDPEIIIELTNIPVEVIAAIPWFGRRFITKFFR